MSACLPESVDQLGQSLDATVAVALSDHVAEDEVAVKLAARAHVAEDALRVALAIVVAPTVVAVDREVAEGFAL